jgi:3-oxoacyl-[acyl-carrier protein] reductase
MLFARAGIGGLTINYRENQTAAEEVAAECRRLGATVVVHRADVARPKAVKRMVDLTVEKLGSLDILVANAGIWKQAAIEDMTEEQWDETIVLNLKSIYNCCHGAARVMLRQGQGTMILVSSTAGQRGEPLHSHYAATKGGIISMSKSLAAELGPRGITVNVVAPGWVVTDMTAEALKDPKEGRKIKSLNPLGRAATPEEIAGPILFLASRLASHINGEVLNVNGGSVLCG